METFFPLPFYRFIKISNSFAAYSPLLGELERVPYINKQHCQANYSR